jgi:hypothetical protein
VPARTGANTDGMITAAAVALALGTLLWVMTPRAGRHARRSLLSR